MITLDNTTSAETSSASSLTYSMTVNTGSNRLLVVQVTNWGTNRATSGVTYGGVAMTLATQGDGNNINASIWYLQSPTVGTANVVVTQPGVASKINSAATSLYGASGQLDSSAGANFNTASPQSQTITTVARNCWLFDAIGDQTAAMTKGTNQTTNLNYDSSTSAGSYKTDVAAGANTMSWTYTGTDNGRHQIAAFSPQTRFYLPSTGTSPASPAFSAGWEGTTIADRLPTYTSVQGSTMTTDSFTDSNATDQDILFKQYVSPPLASQTLPAQTLEFQMRVKERDASCNLFLTINVKLVSYDGAVTRGTLLAMQRDATEANATTLTNRRITATTTAVNAHTGDRLVFEIGMGGDPAGGSDHDSDIRIGDVAADDLIEDDASTTDNNPWIEIPNTITLLDEGDICIDAIATGGAAAAASLTFSYTMTTGFTNSGLLVYAIAFDATQADRNISNITYAGVGMTKLVEYDNSGHTGNIEIWFLAAPATGANNVIITAGGTCSFIDGCAVGLGNVSQTGQPDTSQSETDTSTATPSISVTTTRNKCVNFSVAYSFVTAGINPSTVGQIQLADFGSNFICTSENGTTTPAGSVTHTYTNGATDSFDLVMASIFPPQVVTTKTLLMMGVGV